MTTNSVYKAWEWENSKSIKTNSIDKTLDLLCHQKAMLDIQGHPTQTWYKFIVNVESKLHFQEYEDPSPSKSCCLLSPELGLMAHRMLLSLMPLILYCTTLDKANWKASLTGVSEGRDGETQKSSNNWLPLTFKWAYLFHRRKYPFLEKLFHGWKVKRLKGTLSVVLYFDHDNCELLEKENTSFYSEKIEE